MSMVVGNSLAKSYGALDVFSGVDLRVEASDRIGLVGPNGAGKTSLLKIIAGVEPKDGGDLIFAGAVRVGYLPQDPPPAEDRTLYADLHQVFGDLLAQGEALRALEHHMTADEVSEAELERLLVEYGHMQEAFEQAGGYNVDTRIKQVLTGLGFDETMWPMPLANLSGGQRTRALLGRLLLEEPDLLLLDEPTNHLDIRAVEWLENALREWKGSIVVVSHDRYFLDNVTNRTWEMNHNRLDLYRGNYSHYRLQREDRLEAWRREYEKQQKFIAETQDFVRRYKAGQRSKEARGRETRLNRFLEDEALAAPPSERAIRLPLDAGTRSGDLVLRTRNLMVGYEKKVPILTVPDLEIRRREIVALIGPNGTGKSTLVKTILGELDPLAGRFDPGAGVVIGYLAQRHVGAGFGLMDESQTVLNSLLEIKNLPLTQARTYLGQFLFQGDDVFKTIDNLSGGQRSRIALARLTLQGANFLLLDEPTNHLDLDSQEILQDALQQFSGTVLLVTHDRALVDAIATRLWMLEPGEGHEPSQLIEFKGTWRQWQQERLAQSQAPDQAAADLDDLTDAQAHRERQRDDRRQRQLSDKRAAEAAEVEERVHRMEQRLVQLEEQMSTASRTQDLPKLQKLTTEYQALHIRLDQTMEEWAELAEAV